jgi:hypothetical protein
MTGTRQEPTGWVGWVVFAGITLTIVGSIQVIVALVAFFDQSYFYVASSALAVHLNYAGWGWLQLAMGVLMLAAGYGVLAGALWARVTAIALAALSAVANMAFVAAYPWWALTIIALDVIVIYAVAVHGAEAQAL